MLATTSSVLRSTGPPADLDPPAVGEPGGPVEVALAAGGVDDDATARPALWPEITADQGVDVRPGRPRMGEFSVVVDALMGRRVHVNAGPARDQHGANGSSHQVALHPVERLREARPPGRCRAQPGNSSPRIMLHWALPTPANRARSRASSIMSASASTPTTSREPIGQQQGQRAGAAADVQQSPGAVQSQFIGERIGERVRIRDPAVGVELGRAGVQRRVPGPSALGHRTILRPRGRDVLWGQGALGSSAWMT